MPLIINISAMQNETDVSFNMEDAKSYIESFSLLMEGYEKTEGKGGVYDIFHCYFVLSDP